MVDACLPAEREQLMAVLGDAFRAERAGFACKVKLGEPAPHILLIVRPDEHLFRAEPPQTLQPRRSLHALWRRSGWARQFHGAQVAGQMLVVLAAANHMEEGHS